MKSASPLAVMSWKAEWILPNSEVGATATVALCRAKHTSTYMEQLKRILLNRDHWDCTIFWPPDQIYSVEFDGELTRGRSSAHLSPPIVTMPTAFSRCAFSFALARRLVASSCAARRVGCKSASRANALLSRQTTHASRLIALGQLWKVHAGGSQRATLL